MFCSISEGYSFSNNQPKNQDTWTLSSQFPLSSKPMITAYEHNLIKASTPVVGLPNRPMEYKNYVRETYTVEPWQIASYKPKPIQFNSVYEGYESNSKKVWTLKGPQPDYTENYDYGYRSALVKCKNCKEDFCSGIS